jgi:hypothetical protein
MTTFCEQKNTSTKTNFLPFLSFSLLKCSFKSPLAVMSYKTFRKPTCSLVTKGENKIEVKKFQLKKIQVSR